MSTYGIFNSSNVSPHQIVPSLAKTVFEKMPASEFPLFGITSRLPKAADLPNTMHTWFSKRFLQPAATLTSPVAAGTAGTSAQVQVADSSTILEHMVLINQRTWEQLLVLSVIGNMVTVRRAFGSTGAQAMAAGDILASAGSSFGEGSVRPAPLVRGIDELSNITQIFRNSHATTGTAKALMAQVGDGPTAESLKDCTMFHARDIEQAMLFSERATAVQAGQPIRKMDGIISMIRKYAPSNVVQAGKFITYEALDAAFDPMFDIVTDNKNSNDRLLLVDKVALHAINRMGRHYSDSDMSLESSTFGQQFRNFTTTRGSFKVMHHGMFDLLPMCKGMALAVDLSSMRVPYLKGRKEDYKSFNSGLNSTSGAAQDNGVDSEGGTLTSELTLQLDAPEANGVVFGIREVAINPIVSVPDYYFANMVCASSCDVKKVNAGDTITIKILGGKPGVSIDVVTPTNVQSVALDASGNGSFDYVIGTAPINMFSVANNQAATNMIMNSAVVTVCVRQACDPGNGVDEPIC